jgi:hypothetical protein
LLGAFAAIALSACSDDEASTDPRIVKYCRDLFASPAFSCCSAADKNDRQFAVRNKYGSAGDCADQLGRTLTEGEGRRAFDAEAASSCLAYLGSRTCGAAPTSASQAAEEKAGCSRIVDGTREEGQPCFVQKDCKPGLFCPPLKDSGSSVCTAPAASNEACLGTQPFGVVDHPACQRGLFCELTGENPDGCPSPPCNQYHCVPYGEEGDPCTALDCAEGLACRDGTCKKGPPSAAGGSCRSTEHCADGLFCDPNTGQCAARKAAGAACRDVIEANSIFECKGVCQAEGDGTAVCAAFCSSG